MVTHPTSFKMCQELFATAREPSKGKPLGYTQYRLFQHGTAYDVVYDIHAIVRFCPDDCATVLLGYKNLSLFYSDLVHVRDKCLPQLDAQLYKTYKRPGIWMGDNPVFRGFTMRGSEILTPAVPEIEQKMAALTKQTKQRVLELYKKIKLFHKFGAFNEIEQSFRKLNYRERVSFSDNVLFEELNIDNILSLGTFIGIGKNFGYYSFSEVGTTFGGVVVDLDLRIRTLLKYGAFDYLNRTRLKLYEEWYNAKPNLP